MLTLYYLPLIVAPIAGIVYGYSFAIQQRSIFLSGVAQKSLICFFIRILILAFVIPYLLQSPAIPSILGIILFAIMFWVIILTTKARRNEET